MTYGSFLYDLLLRELWPLHLSLLITLTQSSWPLRSLALEIPIQVRVPGYQSHTKGSDVILYLPPQKLPAILLVALSGNMLVAAG